MLGFVQSAAVAPKKTGKQPFLKNGNDHQNTVLKKAWEISQDENFLCTLLGENIELTTDRKHDYTHSLCWDWKSWGAGKAPNQRAAWPKCKSGEPGYFVRNHTDWGLGVSGGYHKAIVDDPRFSELEWQLQKVYTLWNTGTVFYGQKNCWYTKTLIEWR